MVDEKHHMIFEFFTKFQSFKKTVRVMAFLKRSISCFRKLEKNSVVISAEEMIEARKDIIRNFQAVYFKSELDLLKSKQVISSGSLRTKNAFLDSEGILRIGTRVQVPELC